MDRLSVPPLSLIASNDLSAENVFVLDAFVSVMSHSPIVTSQSTSTDLDCFWCKAEASSRQIIVIFLLNIPAELSLHM